MSKPLQGPEGDEAPDCRNAAGDRCCAPGDGAGARADQDARYLAVAQSVPRSSEASRANLRNRLYEVPGGSFEMGAGQPRYAGDLDYPRRAVFVSPFRISPVTVTNRDFGAFVEATGYRTVAEDQGWSFVFHLHLKGLRKSNKSPPGLRWWRQVEGACWHRPEGPGSTLSDRLDHPVVHIAWYDALAYCTWAGLSLPREAEWEKAARGGLAGMRFPWGDAFRPDGAHAMNTFQGRFPDHDTGEDGHIGTAPANSYAPNGYGLYNMTGNVWEWTSDRFGPLPSGDTGPPKDPTGAAEGYARVQRGGSFLCHESYCDRYHVHSRTQNDPDSSASNLGFRVALRQG